MGVRLGLLGFLTALLLVPWRPGARQANVAAEALTGEGTSYVLEVTNRGSDTLQCMRYTAPPGTRIVSVTDGSTGSTERRSARRINIVTGDTKTWSFTTDKRLPPAMARSLCDLLARLGRHGNADRPCRAPEAVQVHHLHRADRPEEPALFGITNSGLNLGFRVAWAMNSPRAPATARASSS